jgi:hypothetical protein
MVHAFAGTHHSNASQGLYLRSLSSQAEQLGFSKPLNEVRRGEIFEYAQQKDNCDFYSFFVGLLMTHAY